MAELKMGNVEKVLDGEIDEFIQAYLMQGESGSGGDVSSNA